MKSNKVILYALIIVVVLIGAVIFFNTRNNVEDEGNIISDDTNNTNNTQDLVQDIYPVGISGDENVKLNSNGVRENTSELVKQERTVNGFLISNIKLTYLNGATNITADVENQTGQDVNDELIIKVRIKDGSGNVVEEISAMVMGIKSEETKKIDASITTDVVNASDLEFEI